eukprot:156960_1
MAASQESSLVRQDTTDTVVSQSTQDTIATDVTDHDNECDDESEEDQLTLKPKSRKRSRKCIRDSSSSDELDGIQPPPLKKRKVMEYDSELLYENDITSAKLHIATCERCKHWNVSALLNCNLVTTRKEDDAYDRTNWKLTSEYLKGGIIDLCKQMKIKPVMPSVDLFSSVNNYQEEMVWHITKAEDFFSTTFDCPLFWESIVSWANPPYIGIILIKTIKKWRQRKMHGFMIGPYYYQNDEKNEWFYEAKCWCPNNWIKIGDLYDADIYDGGAKSNTGAPFETYLFYFDFRSKNQDQL